MINDKVLSLLGLAMRGRNLVSGEFQTEGSVQNGSALLVIVAEDASANTRKKFVDKCFFYEIPVYQYGTKESLGKAIGKVMRSVVAVCDVGLSEAIIKQLENSGSVRLEDGGKNGED